jgi:hypothetical protein
VKKDATRIFYAQDIEILSILVQERMHIVGSPTYLKFRFMIYLQRVIILTSEEKFCKKSKYFFASRAGVDPAGTCPRPA